MLFQSSDKSSQLLIKLLIIIRKNPAIFSDIGILEGDTLAKLATGKIPLQTQQKVIVARSSQRQDNIVAKASISIGAQNTDEATVAAFTIALLKLYSLVYCKNTNEHLLKKSIDDVVNYLNDENVAKYHDLLRDIALAINNKFIPPVKDPKKLMVKKTSISLLDVLPHLKIKPAN